MHSCLKSFGNNYLSWSDSRWHDDHGAEALRKEVDGGDCPVRQDLEKFVVSARQAGYPVLVKPVAGNVANACAS